MDNVIKEFIVALGFNIDSQGEKNFNSILKNIASNAIKASSMIISAGTVINAFTLKIASNLDKLFFLARSTDSTTPGLEKLAYSFKQVGLSSDIAYNSVQSLSQFLDSSPNASNLLNRIGVNTHNANGSLRDTTEILTDLLDRLGKMPLYRAKIYGQLFGIDENTVKSTRKNIKQFAKEYQEMLKITDYDSNKTAIQSNKFMSRFRSINSLLDILKDKIGGNLAEGLTGKLEKFKKFIVNNFPKIEKVITKTLKVIIDLGGRGIQIIGNIINMYNSLDKSTQNSIKIITALALAIWALYSPILLISALLVGLLLLYDDYKGWQDNKNSAIDWEKWESVISVLSRVFDDLIKKVDIFVTGLIAVFNVVQGIIDIVEKKDTKYSRMIKSAPSKLVMGVNNWLEARTDDVLVWLGAKAPRKKSKGKSDPAPDVRDNEAFEAWLKGNIDTIDNTRLGVKSSDIQNHNNNNSNTTINQTNNININTTVEHGREVVEIIDNQTNRHLNQIHNIKVVYE